MLYRFTESEIKTLAASLVILHDTREQQNAHILKFFDQAKIKHQKRALSTGDYSIMLPACPDLGLPRDLYFNAAIERKNSVDELVATVKDRTRFENELIRGSQMGFFAVLVEDAAGFSKIVDGSYRSQYNTRALQASLAALSVRYDCPIHFVPADLSARWIYLHLRYFSLEKLKTGTGGGAFVGD